jgi:hypothetical protein
MQKILPRLRLFTVCAAILGTAAAYLRLRKVWEAKRSHEQQPEFPIPQEHREAEMADQDSLHKDESAIKSNRTEISSEEPKRKRILRPRISLWTFFALLGVVLAAFGFTLLPPSTASLGFPHEELPVISVWTSQPVPMVIILDASRDGFDPMLEVFADTPPGGIKWDITSSVDDLWNGDSTSAPSNQVTGTAKGSTG